MKKSLVLTLALVFVLGIASTAFAAANPFTDVPAKHWAYDAVSKLAKAGILDGYGDGTYRGERLATRYEMAQAVAKAMARSDKADAQMKALIDKLAVEFAAELNNLGVRVAKLEKWASSIKFGGEVRLRYQSNPWIDLPNGAVATPKRANERLRIGMYAEPNDKTSFTGRLLLQSTNNTDSVGGGVGYVHLSQGYFTFKNLIGNMDFQIGRNVGTMGIGYLADWEFWDGIKLQGKLSPQVFASIGYGDARYAPGPVNTQPAGAANSPEQIGVAHISWQANKEVYLSASYLQGMSRFQMNGGTNFGATQNRYPRVGMLAAKINFATDWWVMAELTKNFTSAANLFNPAVPDRNGIYARLQYKMADRNKVNSWTVWVDYRRLGEDYGLMDYGGSQFNEAMNTKGWGLTAGWVPAKNLIIQGTYLFDLKPTTPAFVGTNKYKQAWQLRADLYF